MATMSTHMITSRPALTVTRSERAPRTRGRVAQARAELRTELPALILTAAVAGSAAAGAAAWLVQNIHVL